MNLLEMNPHETRYIPLIGSPIGGSTASYLYNQIFAAFGINAMSYPVEVKKGELPEFLAAVKFMNTPGCVLTSPHKQDIIQYIDDVDEASRVFRSVNTLRFREDGRIEGHGLDGKGVIGAFDDNDVDLKGKEVVMLGAGGISGIFATELANRGIRKLTILNRTVDKARYVTETLAARTPVETACGKYTPENARRAVETADILIQATTLGMKGSGHDHPDLSFMEALPEGAWVMEAVSNPPETAVIKKAQELGLHTVMGMEMLVNQVSAICKFILDWEAPEEARRSASTSTATCLTTTSKFRNNLLAYLRTKPETNRNDKKGKGELHNEKDPCDPSGRGNGPVPAGCLRQHGEHPPCGRARQDRRCGSRQNDRSQARP